MADAKSDDNIVKNEIKGAIERGYLPFTWDSCFGFKFSTTNDTTNTSDNEMINNKQNNPNCQCRGKNAFKNVNCSLNGGSNNYVNINEHTINESTQMVNRRNERYIKKSCEKKYNYKMCISEVQKIKTLLNRVKSGELTPHQAKRVQMTKEIIHAGLFERWNAIKNSLISA